MKPAETKVGQNVRMKEPYLGAKDSNGNKIPNGIMHVHGVDQDNATATICLDGPGQEKWFYKVKLEWLELAEKRPTPKKKPQASTIITFRRAKVEKIIKNYVCDMMKGTSFRESEIYNVEVVLGREGEDSYCVEVTLK